MKKICSILAAIILSITGYAQGVSSTKWYYLKFLNIYGEMQTINLKGSVNEVQSAQFAAFSKCPPVVVHTIAANITFTILDKIISRENAQKIIVSSIQKQSDGSQGILDVTKANILLVHDQSGNYAIQAFWNPKLKVWSITKTKIKEEIYYLTDVKVVTT